MKIIKKIFINHFCIFTLTLLFSSILSAAPVTNQVGFSSPEEALRVLISTVKDGDSNKLLQILGNEAKPILESGDSVQDKENRKRFLHAYEEGHKLVKSSDTQYVIELGKVGWQFPIPLVKDKNQWYFDTAAGKEEIFNRRIGRNEISTIQAVLSYVEAQHKYYLTNPQNEQIACYAQRFLSTPGKRDGLYFKVNNGEKLSPLGEFFANTPGAAEYDNTKGNSAAPQPYQGYYYRILYNQGPDAQGGSKDYVVQGKMVGGHAVIAWPAHYGNSGVKTFIVNQDGVVYEKDFGPNTEASVDKIREFNPDKSWKPVKDGYPSGEQSQGSLVFP